MTIRSRSVALVMVASFATTSSADATGFTHVLKPGRYKIDVLVEDPASGRQTTTRQVERCLEPQAIAGHVIFEMLSNSPASSCPKYEICAGEFRTGFMAQCLTGEQNSAVGMFALEADGFRGRIEIRNAQDIVTNVEIQYGERIGECARGALPPR